MRLLLALLLLFPVSALAAEWEHYENARYGYGIDIPPGFEAQGEAENGDGQIFRGGFGTRVLTVFGGNLLDGLDAEVKMRKGFDTAAGWTFTYEADAPNWAVWSGTRDGRIVYARIVPLCGGAQFAMFELEYFSQDAAEMDPLVGRIGRSLVPAGGASSC